MEHDCFFLTLVKQDVLAVLEEDGEQSGAVQMTEIQSACLEQWQGGVPGFQDRLVGNEQPLVQHGCIELAEICVVGDIAFAEFSGAEVWMIVVDTTFDLAAKEEGRSRLAVVGAP